MSGGVAIPPEAESCFARFMPTGGNVKVTLRRATVYLRIAEASLARRRTVGKCRPAPRTREALVIRTGKPGLTDLEGLGVSALH
jgi:hypothetical protein